MKTIKRAGAQFRSLLKSKNLKEFFDKVTWELIEKLAFLAVVFFGASPAIQMFNNGMSLLVYDVPAEYYAFTVSPINYFSMFPGIFVILLLIGKCIRTGYKLSDFIRDNKWMLFFVFFALMMFISTIVNGAMNKYIIPGNASVKMLLLYFFVYFFSASMLNSRKLKAAFVYVFLFGSFIMSVLMILHLYVKPNRLFILHPDQMGLIGIFTHFNQYGYYLCLSLVVSSAVFTLEKNKILKFIGLADLIMNSIIIVVNDTFGAYLAALLGMIFMVIVLFICNKKISWLGLASIGILLGTSFIMTAWYDTIFTNFVKLFQDIETIATDPANAGEAGTYRWAAWKKLIEYIKEKPLFGYGIDGYAIKLYKWSGHGTLGNNEFLEYAADFGIPALIAYVGGIMCVFLKGLKYRKQLDIYSVIGLVTAFGYLVSSFFGNYVYYVTPFMFIFLGLGNPCRKHMETSSEINN